MSAVTIMVTSRLKGRVAAETRGNQVSFVEVPCPYKLPVATNIATGVATSFPSTRNRSKTMWAKAFGFRPDT